MSLADGDGQIESAVKGADTEVVHLSCWFHFKGSIRTTYLRWKDEWEPVHDIFGRLLFCDREELYEALIADAQGKINNFTNVALKDKHLAFLNEIVGCRLLARSTTFTNRWTSQSAAESMNAVMQRLGVGPEVPLPAVLDKLICFMEREERETDCWKAFTLQQQEEKFIGSLQVSVTKSAFIKIRQQYDSAVHLACVKITEASFSVQSTSSDKRPRTVEKTQDGKWKCSCNMGIYMGIPCRHQIAVLVALKNPVELVMVDGRWWRSSLQPHVYFAHGSPFSKSSHDRMVQDASPIDGAVPSAATMREEPDAPKPTAVGAESIEDSDCLVASVGNSSDGDMPVYCVDGKLVALPLKPSEVRNEVQSVLREVLNAIGLGPGSIEKMRDLEETVQHWAAKSIAQPLKSGIAALPNNRTVGAPRKVRLEAGGRKARHNGKKSKVKYKCSNCGEEGHTKPKCKKRGSQDAEKSVDFACQECGRKFPDAQARSTHMTLTHNRKRSKAGPVGDNVVV